MVGLTSRNYRAGLEAVGTQVEKNCTCTSKSEVSRRFIQGTEKALAALMSRPLEDERFVALMIDGIQFADHMIVAVLGIDGEGTKHVLGIRYGSTENKAVCRSLLADLMDRGLSVGLSGRDRRLQGPQGSGKGGLRNLVLVQRCTVHKKRNVLEHLPKERQDWAKRQMNRAYEELDHNKAEADLEHLADSLEKQHPGAAASLREGLHETLTVTRLQLPALLRETLSSTNAIESAFGMVRDATRNVKRWSNGKQVLRWIAAGLLEAEERFNRIKGYRDMPLLALRLRQRLGLENREAARIG